MLRFHGQSQEVGGCDVRVENVDTGDSYRLDEYHGEVNHSPDGFQWGYSGSGPAQLAFALLAEVFDTDVAHRHYQQFKDDFVSSLDGDSDFRIHEREIIEWFEMKVQQ